MTRTTSEALQADHAAPARACTDPPFMVLQRVVVRMLFDPEFAARVYDNPDDALAGLDVPSHLVAQLRRNDRRVWTADRLRRMRVLKVLMEEFRISSALVLLETRRLASLDDFFSSHAFHEAVQARAYMALAFVAYLEAQLARGELKGEALRSVLSLEAGMARARRQWREARRQPAPSAPAEPASGERRIVVAPGVGTVLVPGGTIEVIHHLERYLFETSHIPALALCEDAPRPVPLPALDAEAPQSFLFEPDQQTGQIALSGIPRSYHHVIARCREPIASDALARALIPFGLSAKEASEMVSSLIDAGVLRVESAFGGSAEGPS